MTRPRIVFTDPAGNRIIFGSLRPGQTEQDGLDRARAYVQRSYHRHEHEAAMVASVRIENLPPR